MRMRAMAVSIALLGLGAGMTIRTYGAIENSKSEEAALNLQGACAAEIKQYCSDVSPGEGRLASCLQSHEDEFSVPCDSAWLSAKSEVSRSIGTPETALRDPCNSDLQKYCSDLPYGGGRWIDCLDQHQAKLSDSCQQYHAAYEQRLNEVVG